MLGPLRDQAADADPATQEDLRHALFETYDRHFAVPGDPDLPFAIGLLLYELQDYEDAIEFFEASLEQHGHDPATEKNIELCEAMLQLSSPGASAGRQRADPLGAVRGHEEEVLDLDGAEAGPAQERLDRDHVAGCELGPRAADARVLVDLEPDAVAERGREPLHHRLARACAGCGSRALEEVARPAFHRSRRVTPGRTSGDRLGMRLERRARASAAISGSGVAGDERPRDVGEARRLAVLRGEVDDHRLALARSGPIQGRARSRSAGRGRRVNVASAAPWRSTACAHAGRSRARRSAARRLVEDAVTSLSLM